MEPRSAPLSRALLAALAAHPTDASLRLRAARALDREQRHAEALALLREGFVNLTAHEDAGPLPCLCSRCLSADVREAEAEGLAFRRDHATAEGRILFFWSPKELDTEQKSVRRSVAAALKERVIHLRSSAWRRREQEEKKP